MKEKRIMCIVCRHQMLCTFEYALIAGWRYSGQRKARTWTCLSCQIELYDQQCFN